jgi:hypothetical protein
MNEYIVTLTTMFALLLRANNAGTPEAQAWQERRDSQVFVPKPGVSMFKGMWDAIAAIAGSEILNHWSDTGEIDYNLASRMESLEESEWINLRKAANLAE